MKLSTDVLIIGAGYAGLLCQKRLDSVNINNFIVDSGDSVRFSDSDYVIVFRDRNDYLHDESIMLDVGRYSSGAESFGTEFPKKVYGREMELKRLSDYDVEEVFQMDNVKLQEGSRVYGNVIIKSIDTEAKKVYGRVLHLNKEVVLSYNKLISTIPIYEFAKLIGVDLYKYFKLFISFFPVGIVKRESLKHSESIVMEYFSDPQIPFYRKHHFGNSIFYEYCINKPFDIKFNRVVAPGKFIKPDHTAINDFYDANTSIGIHFAGRSATWDPDFLLDHIFSPTTAYSSLQLSRAFL